VPEKNETGSGIAIGTVEGGRGRDQDPCPGLEQGPHLETGLDIVIASETGIGRAIVIATAAETEVGDVTVGRDANLIAQETISTEQSPSRNS
jgi:hypothetical protein